MITIFSSEGGPLDQALPEIFKTKTKKKPRLDSVTFETLQKMVDKPGYCYTCTFTLDLKKKHLKDCVNDPWKQWRHIKNAVTNRMSNYKYRIIMAPECQKNGVIHGHGVLRFQHDNYFDMHIALAKTMKYMSKMCGRNLQWTRINSSTEPYMPTESNKRISKPLTLYGWYEYIHKGDARKWLGIMDTENL